MTLAALFLVLQAAPQLACETTYTPFKDKNRRSFRAIRRRKRSGFGAHRISFIKGHKHAGLDLRGRALEPVYPICAGQVADIHLSFPHLTVVIEHRDTKGQTFYSSYKHIEDVRLKVGDQVIATQRIGRLFSKDERKRAGFDTHLHFEIRKRIDDGGEASWSSMTMQALQRFCRDPERFFKRRLTS